LNWTSASNRTVGSFSAVCWFFGRDLFDAYQVPIGLISSNWGGTPIQAWSSPDALAKCQITGQNSGLYNSMIHPFLPMSIHGATWYQGEANVGQTSQYACMEPAMIADWRSKFSNGYEFGFFFVQLAPWNTTTIALPQMRDAQLAGLSLPGVGYATASDLGDAYSPAGSIHPRDKQPVGQRLANAARAIVYGDSIVWQGPTATNARYTISGGYVTVNITFDLHGSTGLAFQELPSCPASIPTSICSSWVVVYSDNTVSTTWQAHLDSYAKNNVNAIFPLPTGKSPAAVQYGYAPWPLMNLYNNEKLPALPFNLTVTAA